MIPFFTQEEFLAFGKQAQGPFCYIMFTTTSPVSGGVYMLYYQEIIITENGMRIDTMKLRKLGRRELRSYIIHLATDYRVRGWLSCLADDRPLKDRR